MGTDALTQEDTTVCKKNEGQPPETTANPPGATPRNTRPTRQESKTQARRAALRNKTPQPSPQKAEG